MTTVLKLLITIAAGSATAASAAASGVDHGGNSMLIWFFIGFGVMVVMFQAAPAVVMFASMMKGLFSSNPAEASFSPFKGKGNK